MSPYIDEIELKDFNEIDAAMLSCRDRFSNPNSVLVEAWDDINARMIGWLLSSPDCDYRAHLTIRVQNLRRHGRKLVERHG